MLGGVVVARCGGVRDVLLGKSGRRGSAIWMDASRTDAGGVIGKDRIEG